MIESENMGEGDMTDEELKVIFDIPIIGARKQ
jgi:hypothetical protein